MPGFRRLPVGWGPRTRAVAQPVRRDPPVETMPSDRPSFGRTLALALVATLASALPAAAVAPPPATLTAAPAALSPQQAPSDKERLWTNGCLTPEERTTPRTCVFGNRDGSFTLALVGDSHLSHLFAGFDRLARQRGWKLVVYVKVNCPFLDIAVYNPFLEREYTECKTWNARILKRLRTLKPDLTVTLAFRGIRPMNPAQDTSTREGKAIGRMLAKVPGRTAIIVDTPYSYRDVPGCLRKHASDPDHCRIPSYEVLTAGVRTRERAAASVSGATYIDLTKRICGGYPCRVVSNGNVMFRDKHHLTNTYAATLRDVLGNAIDRALR